MPSKWKFSSGLTLVELLVAISVLALVAVLGWRGLDSIVRTRESLTQALEQTRAMQLSFAQLQSDCAQLAHAVQAPGRPLVQTGAGYLMLLRRRLDEQQAPRLQVVVYRLHGSQLTRTASPATRDLQVLDAWWVNLRSDTSQPSLNLLADIDNMAVQLLDNHGNTSATAPRGIRVALQLRAQRRPIVKLFLLGAQ